MTTCYGPTGRCQRTSPCQYACDLRADAILKDAIQRVRLFGAPTLKERIQAAIEHAEANDQMRDALWPHQHFALTLGELLRAAERGA